MTKQNISSPAATATATAVPNACGNCAAEERLFLHHVHHRGIFRRLCTNCVLRLNPQSFCPTCFRIHNTVPPPSTPPHVTCNKCYSVSHSSCIAPNSPQAYTCPLCLNPNFPNFSGVSDDGSRVVDNKAATILLTAARIAAASMNKAAAIARSEAEKRVKEAFFSRKRAREALDHVAYLSSIENLNNSNKAKRKEDVLPFPQNNVNNNNRGSSNSQCLSMVVSAVPLKVENNVVDGSSDVLVALNAVHLKGQENPIPGAGLNNNVNGSAMDVEANWGARVTPSSVITEESVQSAMGAEDDRCGNAIASNGMVSVQDDEDHHMGNSKARVPNGGLP